jgi:hypothetical protein
VKVSKKIIIFMKGKEWKGKERKGKKRKGKERATREASHAYKVTKVLYFT